jgi:hypothetical protein
VKRVLDGQCNEWRAINVPVLVSCTRFACAGKGVNVVIAVAAPVLASHNDGIGMKILPQ